jgi:hypothetical protein
LGLTELARNSLEWDDKNNHFVGRSTSGSDLLISFNFSKDLPNRALVLNTAGATLAYVDYEYSTNIYSGKLPIRFSRHIGSPTREIAKMVQVEILELELEVDTVNAVGLDPANIFHPKNTAYYSNSVMYGVETSGKSTKVLTMAEYQASMVGKALPKKPYFVRFLIISIMTLGLVAIASLWFQKNKNKNKNE